MMKSDLLPFLTFYPSVTLHLPSLLLVPQMSNVHAWFAETLVEDAAGWTWEYFNKNAPSTALLAPNNPAVYMAEVGW